MLVIDVFVIVLFGTAISSVINFFLSTQGQISAVGSIVSSGYGFICGAYMPISTFSVGLQKVISCLPGTYGTALIKNHAMQGAFNELLNQGIPAEVVNGLKDAVDCNVYFFNNAVSQPMMFAILLVSIAVLFAVYVALNVLKSKRA
jgi:multidrug/hemolysin transport system permease protein